MSAFPNLIRHNLSHANKPFWPTYLICKQSTEDTVSCTLLSRLLVLVWQDQTIWLTFLVNHKGQDDIYLGLKQMSEPLYNLTWPMTLYNGFESFWRGNSGFHTSVCFTCKINGTKNVSKYVHKNAPLKCISTHTRYVWPVGYTSQSIN